ncbi:MAG: aminopeptidase [Candidatus Thermoplasmatota archaeon]|nr:aminopeptidase [Candidatus Thermoplasmatota archaeon]
MGITEKRMIECAKNMVKTCNVKKGDGVVVKGGAHTQMLLEEIALECYRKGATPTIICSSDRYAKKIYKEIPAKTLETVPKQYVGMIQAADILISVEEFDDPKIAETFPIDKLTARQKASLPIYDIIFHPTDGKKWLYAGWPTEASAKSFGIPYKELENIIIGGIGVPGQELMKIGMKMAKGFKNAEWVHVWDKKGTDFRVKVDGRRLNIDDGFTSDEDYRVGDRGANLPAGELFIAPHETQGEGTIFSPITRDRMTDKLVTNVRLAFKDGKLLLNKTTADKNLDALISSFKECQAVDKKKYKPVRTMNVGELGIGYNPKIKKAVGYILTDEKVAGTVHVAFGSNNSYGGTSESTMHWDFVSAPGVNIEVQRLDGKVTQVMTKGKLL